MQMPFPMSARVNAPDTDVNVRDPDVVAPSVPVRSADVPELEPPLLFDPDFRTYHDVGCLSESAGGPMSPVRPELNDAYPFVSPYGCTEPAPQDVTAGGFGVFNAGDRIIGAINGIRQP